MKKHARWILAVFLCILTAFPQTAVQVKAAASVRVAYRSRTKTYKKRKNYVNTAGVKKKISDTPIFMKAGAYEGPASAVFSGIGVKVKGNRTRTRLTMRFGGHTLVMRSGSRKASIDGRSTRLAAPVFYGKYRHSGKKRWIVPLRSVSSRLGINYKIRGGVITVSRPEAAIRTTETDKTSKETSTASPQKKVILVLDAGHGGSDSGAVGNGLAEKALTLRIVLAARDAFSRDQRFQVYYTRTADTYPSLSDRYKLANNVNADLFLCVHINCGGGSGTETLYSVPRNSSTAKNGVTSYSLASYMQDSTAAVTGFRSRGLVNRPNLAVLKHTNMPACLIEYGFLDNAQEAKIMNAHTSQYGQQLYNAVVSYTKSKGLIQ